MDTFSELAARGAYVAVLWKDLMTYGLIQSTYLLDPIDSIREEHLNDLASGLLCTHWFFVQQDSL
jgi:hypothetical protein